MTVIKLDKSQYTVLPDGDTGLPPETEAVFKTSKLRLENIIWADIDIESQEGKERYNYAVFKAIALRIYETLEDPTTPLSVSNSVRRMLSEINADFEFRSPKEALSHRFQNGLTFVGWLYECGYFDCSPTLRRSVEKGTNSSISPSKNVESLEKLSLALGLPALDDWSRDVLRMAGALNRSVEPDGSSSMDCRLAALQFWRRMLSEEGMDPNEIIGSFGETTFYLMAKYMVDPRNFWPLEWSLKRLKAKYAEFDPNATYVRAVNPNITDRKGVSIAVAARAHSAKLDEFWFNSEVLDRIFRRTMWLVDEFVSDWSLLSSTFWDTPMAKKLRNAYPAH